MTQLIPYTLTALFKKIQQNLAPNHVYLVPNQKLSGMQSKKNNSQPGGKKNQSIETDAEMTND